MAPSSTPSPDRVARTAFALLFALMVVNYLDRQVVVAMFTPLKAAWSASDTELGLLVSIVSMAIAICTVPLSLAADRLGRVPSIAAMAIVWSLATMGGALAQSYGGLLATRVVVGVGEAAFGTVAVALLATLYPETRRGAVLGGFFAASILGSALGTGLGGYSVQRFGWPATFVAVGLPGVVLGFVFLFALRGHRDPSALPRGAVDLPPLAMLAAVLRSPTLRLACAGAGFQLLPVAMTYAWLPTYLARTEGATASHAGVLTALFVLASGTGVVGWGWIADRLASRHANARLLVPCLGAVATPLLLTPAFAVPGLGALQIALVLAGGVAMMASVAPISAVVLGVVPPGLRATGASVLALVQNLVGLAGGPLLAGLLSDRYGLAVALALVPLLCLPAAACFALACRTHATDLQRATMGDARSHAA